MIKGILCVSIALCVFTARSQNVFNPSDPTVRYDKTKGYGTAQRPDTNQLGLQKWVSTATTGVTGSFDATSYKAYFLNVKGVKLAFRLKFPHSYSNPDSASKVYPMMLFLHGAGEGGCNSNNGIYNNEKQLYHGGSLFMQRVDNNQFDGFLIYPQLINGSTCSSNWGSTDAGHLNLLMSIVDSVIKYTRADADRLLITGLSGGGFGGWRLPGLFPQKIAKLILSASAGTVDSKQLWVHIPMWFATGGRDTDPSPAQAQYDLNQLQSIGADVRYTVYPELGHAVWSNHWFEPDFVAEMNKMHKANPLIFFQHKDFCANETVAAKLGITQNFYAYEWTKDGQTIATSTNGARVITQAQYVTSYTIPNEITVKAYGTYRVRFKRTAGSNWSVFSPVPAVIGIKSTTQAVPIAVSGIKSITLPAPDGSTTTPLTMPGGFINYEWYRSTDNVKVGSTQVYNAPVGTYKARYSEQFGCGTTFSPDFAVVNANGTPKPDAATNLVATSTSTTSAKVQWSQNASPASNETGFEIYRGTKAGGPYQLLSITAANATTFNDTTLTANTLYFYVVRAVNATGGSPVTAEASVKTGVDNVAPGAPANLQYRGSTQTTVQLRWTAPADNDINHYDIFVNGSKMFSTTSTSYNVTGLDSLNTYAFTIKAIDNTGNISPASSQVSGYTHRQGVNYKYYTGTWSTLPNFATLTPAKSGITDSVNINNTSIKTITTKYAFKWEGFIYIPVAATYTFETVSDDGSKVYIDVPYSSGATAVVNNDGTHSAQSRTGTKALTVGYHTIAVTYFQDNNSTFSMQLLWSNNAGLAREGIPKNFFAFVNGTTGAAPAIPTALAASATAYNKIKLTWTDNSNNETGFEVVRSLTSGGTFNSVGTSAANATTYTDSGLAESKAYFYKIRAVSADNASAYTAQVSATTPAAPATPVAPSDLSASASGTSVTVAWTDNATNETNYRIYRSTDNVNFGVIATLAANVNAYTDPTVSIGTRYYYFATAINAAGESGHSNTADAFAGDGAPVIGSLNDFTVKTYSSGFEDFTVTDNPGDIITVTIVKKPAFLNLSNNGSNYRMTATPTVNNVGTYVITLIASDNHGNSASTSLSMTVADRNTRSVFVNFGSATKAAPTPWNNWLGARGAGNVISNLKDEANVVTPFSVTSLTAWAALTDMGHLAGDNSGIVPDAVLQSGLADNNPSRQFKISGLNPANRYNLTFIGSQNEGLEATTLYTVGVQTSGVDTRYNTTRSANLNELVPDVTGSIIVTVSKAATTYFNKYLNGMIIEELDPSVTILNPGSLFAQATDRTTVSLTWSDRTNSETAYELVRATDSLFTQNVVTISLPANTISYTNTGLAADTRYWYHVRATGPGGTSEFSNQVRTVTPGALVYVNYNQTTPDAAAPWNNLNVDPTTFVNVANLKNQSGAATTIGYRIDLPFNGEFTAGVVTGNNSGVVPDNVLVSDFWLDNGQNVQARLTGLNHAKKYRIGFTNSASANGWFRGDYTTTSTVNGKTVYLNAWMNSTKIVYLDNLAPNASGDLVINYSTSSAALYGFTGGLIVQEYTDRQEDGSIATNLVLDPAADPLAATADLLHARAYPNPFNDFVLIDINNPVRNQRISAEIYDVQGRLTDRQVFENVPQGGNTLRIRSSARNTGTYILVLKSNGKILNTIKLLKAR